MNRNTLKDKQRDAIKSFMNGNNTMVILPTGYGKSVIYQAAPFCLDYLIHAQKCSCNEDSHTEQKNIAVVVSPLTALRVNNLLYKIKNTMTDCCVVNKKFVE